jgi:methyl-accepting chemotaxis protein
MARRSILTPVLLGRGHHFVASAVESIASSVDSIASSVDSIASSVDSIASSVESVASGFSRTIDRRRSSNPLAFLRETG